MRGSIFTPVLVGGSLILLIGFAIRAAFGVFQIPIASEFDWPRAEFSLALAIQNLAWGIGQPIFGALAEKIGDRRAIVLGALAYAAGLLLSAGATTPVEHQLYEIIVGFGVAGTGFGVILAVVGRAAKPEHRSMSLAIATAAGSAGQVVGPLVAEGLLAFLSWQAVFVVFAAAITASLALLPLLKAPVQAQKAVLEESMGTIVKRAFKDPSYALIFIGFFSCGYQLAFVTAHFPAFVAEVCGPIAADGALAAMGITTTSALGALAISVVGLANIVGTLLAGYLGNLFPKKYLLAAIYAGRTMIAAWFILTPMTPFTVLVFSALMGALWLATVPLTSGLVAQLYGVRYMGTLYGIVFFSTSLAASWVSGSAGGCTISMGRTIWSGGSASVSAR